MAKFLAQITSWVDGYGKLVRIEGKRNVGLKLPTLNSILGLTVRFGLSLWFCTSDIPILPKSHFQKLVLKD